MERAEKLRILADGAKYDASCASSGAKRSGNSKGIGHTDGTGICHSYTPDGRCVSLLKILLTNYCVLDCVFCVNRVSSDIRRARFTPQEVIDLTLDFYRRNYIEGLFLSSGIFKSPDETMQELIDVAKGLRETHHFGGYIHLKVIPGASPELIEEAGRWADRLSANIELPTQGDLDDLAPEKDRAVIETSMNEIHTRLDASKDHTIKSRARPPRFAPAGQTTQMIVGATEASDRTILDTATSLYDRHELRRIYYSGYSPYPEADSRLPFASPPLIREHRLYQADWLMRFYGFDSSELTTDDEPNLSLERDPKLSWALRNRSFFPVDVNRDSLERILRVPGIGTRSAGRIVRIRRHHRLRMDDLERLRIPLRRARYFVTTADFNPDVLRVDALDLDVKTTEPTLQMNLFDAQQTSVTGEL